MHCTSQNMQIFANELITCTSIKLVKSAYWQPKCCYGNKGNMDTYCMSVLWFHSEPRKTGQAKSAPGLYEALLYESGNCSFNSCLILVCLVLRYLLIIVRLWTPSCLWVKEALSNICIYIIYLHKDHHQWTFLAVTHHLVGFYVLCFLYKC